MQNSPFIFHRRGFNLEAFCKYHSSASNLVLSPSGSMGMGMGWYFQCNWTWFQSSKTSIMWTFFMRLMHPDGFPDGVTSDYLEFSLWRGVHGITYQLSGVLFTQSLLYVGGLGKRAIPTAAAMNWVLKDGIRSQTTKGIWIIRCPTINLAPL
ncbi:unnamed protein product [Lactuca virosa]|uniref:Protein root UVB sensitive/RUS domain-containing protein n=1 Tax=Lactuca virosa TaxID=75947 RepID=A0AAU9N8T6_9ASTR|nr:unnamed protein product [Lactuca virosa]